MIAVATPPSVDREIDAALSRIRERAARLGAGFGALGGALTRAAEGGKRFRPALVTAAFDAFGGDPASTAGLAPVAAAFELLHAAFVVHDDVIDHDLVRRGIPNVAGEFRDRALRLGADDAGASTLGAAAAILAGDLLLHEALRLIALADSDAETRTRLHDLVDDAIFVSAAGELADVEQSVTAGVPTRVDTLTTAFNKTAVYSFRAPLVAGAVLAGADADATAALSVAAGHVGLAYQLVDDLIGAFGTADQAGRDSGADLKEAKRTPLVALAHETARWEDVQATLARASTGPVAVREAQRALEHSGARDRLRELVESTLADARFTAGDPALPEAATEVLRGLADLVERRIP